MVTDNVGRWTPLLITGVTADTLPIFVTFQQIEPRYFLHRLTVVLYRPIELFYRVRNVFIYEDAVVLD